MKNNGIIMLLVTCGMSLQAQKVIEKNIDYKRQMINMDVKFASEIEVKTWDKNTIYFKADLQTEGGKYLDLYKLDVMENSSTINITSRPEPVFKEFQEEWKRNHPGEKNGYYNDGDRYVFNYVLYVPKNARFGVSSINGNLKADVIEGDFKADLINGDIDITRYAGNLELSTINGEIDLKMSNTSLYASTIHGNIYADEKLQLTTEDGYVGQKVKGRFDRADNSLRLNTINGNMYLRL